MTKIISFVSYKDKKSLKKLINPNYNSAVKRQSIIKNLEIVANGVLKANKSELRDNAIRGVNSLIAFYKYVDLDELK